ncbi:hypothetical protein QVD17_19394 [Tagetes erecta]|uniref:Uncharacterized protein n=1 Tax=Tagetes erecta TaxID=13708 RepID=A0AAD8NWX2_TARER|nr:hypothetical protein QVD17_19394 [Tagetes erecta]
MQKELGFIDIEDNSKELIHLDFPTDLEMGFLNRRTIHSRSAHKQVVLAKRPVLTHFEDISKFEADEENGLSTIKGDKVIVTLYTEADIAALNSHNPKIILKKDLKPI